MLTNEEKKELLGLARTTIESYLEKGIIHKYIPSDPVLNEKCGAFVTLHKQGNLRGCIGLIEGNVPLFETIIEMAIEAATNDPRFEPVKLSELKDIDLEISVLFPKRRVKSIDEIELGRHGVLVRRGYAGGVFLPQVATETGWSKEEFMENLCSGKAGLAPDAYKDPKTEIYVFEAEVFGEKEHG
ncbi:MAG: AmmeMemoRadiSam system protein A [Spirochaetia bacterium]|nr:AmmeMemoRadiSam system protein A [Spirochaetia bacterium]